MQATKRQIWNGLGPLGTSAILHLTAILAVVFFHFPLLKAVAPEITISVELLPQTDFGNTNVGDRLEQSNRTSPGIANAENVVLETTVVKRLPAETPGTNHDYPSPETRSAIPKESSKRTSPTFVRATHFYASEVLRNPKSSGTARDLRQLSVDERMIQLCNLEAMEQVSRWNTHIKADFLVSYAMAETRRAGQKITADGGAIRSKGHWFNLKYSCDVTTDLESVDRFEFMLGDEIPEADWASHNLPSGENFDD